MMMLYAYGSSSKVTGTVTSLLFITSFITDPARVIGVFIKVMRKYEIFYSERLYTESNLTL